LGLRIWEGIGHRERQLADCSGQQTNVNVNYKSQNPNNKQITMTEIQNSKRSHHLKKREFQYMFGSLSIGI
jgi:hypothetical protein